MREVCEDLGPDHAKVANATAIEFSEATVQDVAAHVQRDANYHCLASFIAGTLLARGYEYRLSVLM